MRKIVILLLCFFLFLAGCNWDNPNGGSLPVDSTGSDSIAAVVNEASTTQENNQAVQVKKLSADFFDLSQYEGEWFSEEYEAVVDKDMNPQYEFGSRLIIDSNNKTIDLTDESRPPSSRIAEVEATLEMEAAKGFFTFEDDGWGNAGKGTVEFSRDKVVVDITITDYAGENWEIFSGKSTFVRNKNTRTDTDSD
ncbi:MAG TPA: hypothetical protein VHT96_18565 [Clostridia bacterium]|nr:hypothetical protein [Clostridia bacterium]